MPPFSPPKTFGGKERETGMGFGYTPEVITTLGHTRAHQCLLTMIAFYRELVQDERLQFGLTQGISTGHIDVRLAPEKLISDFPIWSDSLV